MSVKYQQKLLISVELQKDLGYPPVMVFIDEVTALVAAFDNKEHKQFKLLRKHSKG